MKKLFSVYNNTKSNSIIITLEKEFHLKELPDQAIIVSNTQRELDKLLYNIHDEIREFVSKHNFE
jgi:hypothetical protein